MRNCMIKRSELLFCMFVLLVGTVSIVLESTAAFFGALLIFTVGFIFLARELNNNAFIIVFLISFFTFLVGSEAINLSGLKAGKYIFPEEINTHSYIAIVISLVFLFIAYIAAVVILRTRCPDNKTEGPLPAGILPVRKASLFTFYFLVFFKTIVNTSELLFTRQYGYSSTYTDYHFPGPNIFVKLATMCTTAFFVYLGTLPSKKECRIPVLLYVFVNFITFLSGRRNELISAVLLVFIYYCVRNVLYSNHEVWVPKKKLLVLLIASPLLLSFLYAMSALRKGNLDSVSISYFNGILDFFHQQGFSINIIKWEKSFEASMPDKVYSFGQTFEFLTSKNFLSRLLFDFKTYSGHTVERALEGYRMSYLISYLAFPWSYAKGYGTGSCYIAEAYHDFGYLGVALFNCVYGYLFARFNSLKYRGPLLMAVSFLMMQELLMAPRSYADAFIGSVLTVSNVEIILFIWLVSIYVCSSHVTSNQAAKDVYINI